VRFLRDRRGTNAVAEPEGSSTMATDHDTPTPSSPTDSTWAVDEADVDEAESAGVLGSDTEPDRGAVAGDRLADALMSVRTRNYSVTGRLTAHFTARDVEFELDGPTAMRTIELWQTRPTFLPRLDPDRARADWSWVGIDLAAVLGFTWEPKPPTGTPPPERLTVDPIN
jgi:hypothetical protein